MSQLQCLFDKKFKGGLAGKKFRYLRKKETLYGFMDKIIGMQPNAVNVFFLEQTIEHHLYLYQLGLSGQVEKNSVK